MKRGLLIFLVWLCASPAFAQVGTCNAGYTVFFGNGIRTTALGAKGNKNALVALNGPTFKQQNIDYQMLYNPTNGMFGEIDILEVLAQKRDEFAQFTVIQLQEALLWLFNPSYQIEKSIEDLAALIQKSLPEIFADMTKGALNRMSDTTFEDEIVVSMTNTYKPLLLEGRKVLVVPHSQGNLYANATYHKLKREAGNAYSMASFGIAGIATPANGVPDGNPYVTSNWDMVINVLRGFVPTVLLPNYFEFTPHLEDWMGHNFDKIYANPSLGISARTKAAVQQALERLDNNNPNTSGPFTVTLTWDKAGDVDLEVIEPNDKLVFFADRRGDGGYLDRDDLFGRGPEHYFTSCTAPLVGTYRVGVNYFSGFGPRVATVVVSVNGTSYPSRQITLPEDKGVDGIDSPSVVYTLELSKKPDGSVVVAVK